MNIIANPVLDNIILDIFRLILRYVNHDKASDLLMRAAHEQADTLENAEFPPDPKTGK